MTNQLTAEMKQRILESANVDLSNAVASQSTRAGKLRCLQRVKEVINQHFKKFTPPDTAMLNLEVESLADQWRNYVEQTTPTSKMNTLYRDVRDFIGQNKTAFIISFTIILAFIIHAFSTRYQSMSGGSVLDRWTGTVKERGESIFR